MSLVRWLHTVRHLRRRQVVGQVGLRLRRVLENPARFASRPTPPPAPVRWQSRSGFFPCGLQARDPAGILRGEFRFLNRTHDLGWPPRWDAPSLPPLHRYNLHYFEYLWALEYADARGGVRDWIRQHRLARGRIGWDAYPTSLRLVNWCAYFLGRHGETTAADTAFAEELWASIHLQAEWLRAHLETHLLGNHLLENAVALALCGSCFRGPQADRWLRTGERVLADQLPEQIRPDGGHVERSPMYHLRVAIALTTLLDVGRDTVVRLVEEPLARMMAALPRLCHPDREIALINDSGFGVYGPPDVLRQWWERVAGRQAPDAGLGAFALRDTGFYGSCLDNGHYLICDAGPLGPDYLLGHAHAGIFSFELSLHGQRVIVDSGVHGYEPDGLRDYCRSTRAHNTVEIEGEDQCELWAAFRVGRRGRPRDVAFEAEALGFRLQAWHDGYQRLPGRPRHRRRFRWENRGVLTVEDVITSSHPVRVVSRLHLHPDCEIRSLDATKACVEHPRGRFTVIFNGDGRLAAEESSYCPEFGLRLDNRALRFSASGARVDLGFRLEDGAR